CQPIPGAAASTYRSTLEDADGSLEIAVTATNDAGSATAVSAPFPLAQASQTTTAATTSTAPTTTAQTSTAPTVSTPTTATTQTTTTAAAPPETTVPTQPAPP